MPQFPGTRSNSRHISGSILGGSESQVIEKLARKSVHYWRNSGYKNISSWKWRDYQHTQRLLLSTMFAIPSVISLSYARKARPYACTLIVRSQEVDPWHTLAMIQEEESGIHQGDQRHTPALLSLWVDRSFPEMHSRLHSRATCRGSKYYGSTRK